MLQLEVWNCSATGIRDRTVCGDDEDADAEADNIAEDTSISSISGQRQERTSHVL